MALQLLYSFWQENGVEKSFRAESKGLLEEDISYILHRTVNHTPFCDLPKDDENSDHTCTTYLNLPSGVVAIVRTGYYDSGETTPKDGFILHAYIAEQGETVSPFLYVENDCFKHTLTKDERLSYSSYTLLPALPFPIPQFVLTQGELQEFFSGKRQGILSQLLQALIDGSRSKRITILNENHSCLKYWFYAIHCCLPEDIKKDISFSTSAYDKIDDCGLICGAAHNKISNRNEIAYGNFVFDTLGGQSSENIESVKYPDYIVKLFATSAEAAFSVSKKIHNYMDLHQLSFSMSVGIMKLLDCEFDWFDSAYDVQFFLGKVSFAAKEEIENTVYNLWHCFKDNAFSFKIDKQTLPLLTYIFKNSNSNIKREIIEYVEGHYEQFGICEGLSVQDHYAEVMDRLGFVYTFLPSALIRTNCFDDYCDYLNRDLSKLSVLLYVIVDRYLDLTKEYGDEPVHNICRKIFVMFIENGDDPFAIDFCHKVEKLPDTFVEQVVVRGVWLCVEHAAKEQNNLDEEFVFKVIEELIKKPKAASALLMVFARKGRYAESTVSMYMNLCRRYPNETAVIDDILSQRDTFSLFMSDMSWQRFMEQRRATFDDLSRFFYRFYLKDQTKAVPFEKKVKELIESLSPVLQIEMADYMIRLFANSCSDYHNKDFVHVLASYIVNQSVNDIYDYYANSDVDTRAMTDILIGGDYPISREFYAAILCVDLKNIVLHEQYQFAVKGTGSNVVMELFSPDIISQLPTYTAENKLFWEKFYRYLFRAMLMMLRKKRKLVQYYTTIFKNFLSRVDFQDALISFVKSFEEVDDIRLEPILASVLLLKARDEFECDRVYSVCEKYLLFKPLEKRKERFRGLTKYAFNEKEREDLKWYLTELYFSDLNIFQKLLTVSPKELFV